MKKLLRKIKRTATKFGKLLLVRTNYPNINWLNNPILDDTAHLDGVMKWLCDAQDAGQDGGVSCYYDIVTKKWGKPYRETTGYIIETFINYYHSTNDLVYLERAKKMGNWELEVQCEDGSFGEIKDGGTIGKKIFNTAQVIIGLISLYIETKDNKFILSAEKAGLWLIKNQEPDGSWKKFTTQGPKTYHSRVAWPLLQIYRINKNKLFLDAAEKNIYWVIKQQEKNYWFKNTSLSEEDKPWTHLIAYTISGLIEYYNISENKDKLIYECFYNSANKLLQVFSQNDKVLLPCSFDLNWETEDKYSCLTGDAQLAIVWMQIYGITNDRKFLDGAEKIIKLIKKTHPIKIEIPGIKGGIFGSSPIDGDYAPFALINWAAKFFADALILKSKMI